MGTPRCKAKQKGHYQFKTRTYAIINVLLNKTAQVLPECDSNTKLADNFLSSFKDKVDTIRSNVSSHPDTNVIVPKQTSTVFCMPEFEQLTCDAVKQIIMRLSNKSCSLDTLPSWLVKNNLSTLLPVITKIVNASLSSGIFPSNLKHSVITPVLKKSSVDRNDLKSYRPVANVPFLSKVIEKVATCQVINHVDSYTLGEQFQSAYKRFHSTETALLRVKNDILHSLDKSKAVLMVLLDMSAAFDTVDHDILLQRLHTQFGISSTVNTWFSTYIKNRTTKVSIKGDFSRHHVFNYSIPQGSIVGPLAFKSESDRQRVLSNLSSCVLAVNKWMAQNMLQLNQGKTEFIVFANSHVLSTLPNLELILGDFTIPASTSVKNLGVSLDCSLNMSHHISSVCKTVNFHIRNLWRIRRFITQSACHHAVRSLVLSRLDYANSLLVGARKNDLARLQRLQNKAARLVFACGRDQPSPGLIASLHWLPVKERISFKIFTHVYKILHTQSPSYLVELVHSQNSNTADEYRQRLRSSADQTRLSVPRTRRKAGDSSFSIAAPRLWNELPAGLREAISLPVFKSLLKTFLFPHPS